MGKFDSEVTSTLCDVGQSVWLWDCDESLV